MALLGVPIDDRDGDNGPTAGEVLGELVPAPLYRVPDPSPDPSSPYYVEGVWFDESAVERFVSCAGSLRHQKGRWRGEPIVLEDWQIEHWVAPVFGWKYPNGLRVRRQGFLEVSRKNGKTTTCAVCALVLLAADGEQAPEVYAAATTYQQALTLWKPAVAMATGSPYLARRVREVRGGQTKEHLAVPGNGGEFWPVSRNADAIHGANPHGAVVDELHLHPDSQVIDALDTGTLAREQPLMLIITTADEGDTGTPYDEWRRMIEGMSAGSVPWNPGIYGAVYAAPDDADPFDARAMARANPNLGVTIRLEDLEKQAAKARIMPSYLNVYRRLHLGQRRRSTVRWLPIDYWMASPRIEHDPLDPSELPGLLSGVSCWGALDMASVDDFVAWVMVFPRPVEVPAWRIEDDDRVDDDGISVVARFWVPRGAVDRRRRFGEVIEGWADDGWVTITEGDATDYAAIRDGVFDDLDRFDLREVGFDHWQSRQLMSEIGERVDVAEVAQNYGTLAPGAHWLEGAVLRRAVEWENPVLTWMVGNAIARRDRDNRVKPDKQASGEKIDGVSALVMALSTWLDPEEEIDIEAQVR